MGLFYSFESEREERYQKCLCVVTQILREVEVEIEGRGGVSTSERDNRTEPTTATSTTSITTSIEGILRDL